MATTPLDTATLIPASSITAQPLRRASTIGAFDPTGAQAMFDAAALKSYGQTGELTGQLGKLDRSDTGLNYSPTALRYFSDVQNYLANNNTGYNLLPAGVNKFDPRFQSYIPLTNDQAEAFAAQPLANQFAARFGYTGNDASNWQAGPIDFYPDQQYRLIDRSTGQVVGAGIGYAGGEQLAKAASALVDKSGNQSNWIIEGSTPGTDNWSRVASQEPEGHGFLTALGLMGAMGALALAPGLFAGNAAAGATATGATATGAGTTAAGLGGGIVVPGGVGGLGTLSGTVAGSLGGTAGVAGTLSGAAAGLGGIAVPGAVSGLGTALGGTVAGSLGGLGAAAVPAAASAASSLPEIVVNGALSHGLGAGAATALGTGATAAGTLASGFGGGASAPTAATGQTAANPSQPAPAPAEPDPTIVVNGATGGGLNAAGQAIVGTGALGVGALGMSGGGLSAAEAEALANSSAANANAGAVPGASLTDKLSGYLGDAALVVGAAGNLLGGNKSGSGSNGTVPAGVAGMAQLKPVFSASLPTSSSFLPGGSPGTARQMPQQDWNTYAMRPEQSFFTNVPQGGLAKGGLPEQAQPLAHNPLGGRSDDRPVMVSPGEYVMDAETVSLLGNGDTKSGAKALDQFRVNVRKHKGKALAKGKISSNAKRPEAYMAGGLTHGAN